MTKTSSRDVLLTAAHLLILLMIGVLSFAVIMLCIGLPASIIFQSDILAEAAAKGVVAGPELIGAIALVLAGSIGLISVALYFLVLLRRIVSSVGEGDPFTPDNADRLSRMGWLALGGQLLSIPVGAVVMWIASLAEGTPAAGDIHIDSDFGFSVDGLLLVLILFILARVFRHGTALREDIEGTI